MNKHFVISISGISGGGKTTVANALKDRLTNSVIVSFDDYDDVRLDRDINEWSANGNDENKWQVEPIAKDIERLLNENFEYIIIDYPFGYKNLCVGKFINFAVFINTPLDVALARRTIRDYTSRSADRNKIEVNLETIEKELQFYLTVSRPTYARMAETQIPCSDLVVDGMKAPEEIVNNIINILSVRSHYDSLIDENNDPVRDVQILRDYMDKWDGEAFFDLLQLDKTKTVLEIGVGSGRLAIKTLPLVGHFAGIDISPKTIKRAAENLAKFKNKALICANFLEYEFTEKFDVIYSSLTFLHIKEKQKAINKIAELLKNGGRVVLSISKDQTIDFECNNRKLILYPDTPEEIKQFMLTAGLVVVGEKETEFANIIVAKRGN